ncbi:ribose-5-phosphate isomerase a [Klebsormidium nitens]|uniref:ribose-5-phosphate isomerase n=1 Tax=Klebsormidium nitens TaxID=105231 RepID=A0A1Y1IUI4_KLENI|nr:ribose-5-phosphate isomerase a [Klebsormidium nitens]|eukprot:GAQ91888.1 ribose-5-phosphate isomerase a [Klebsormidium nitens]
MTVASGAPSSSQALDPEVQEDLKRAVAKKAVEMVQSGQIVGLGTGSTSALFIEELGQLISKGKLKDVYGVATSYQAKVLSRQAGIKTLSLNEVNRIDVAFDGADEVDSQMNLIKGGGAAHTMEKVVDKLAKKAVILVDQTKVVSQLGLVFPVAVEVLQPAITPVLRSLLALGGEPEIRSALRKDGPIVTDLGNFIVDVRFPNGIKDAAALEKEINNIPGVVENGLFTGFVQSVLVGVRDGNENVVVQLAEAIEKIKP